MIIFFSEDRRVAGKIRHRERTVAGAVMVTEAISLADAMDISRDRLELVGSKGAAESVLSAYPR